MKKVIGILAILGLVAMFVGCKGTTDSGTSTPVKSLVNMVRIEGGTFSRDDDGTESGTTTHNVTVSGFYMGETEVTQAQWEAVMGTIWPGTSDSKAPSETYGIGDNYPAYFISWYDAVEFCNALSEKEGLDKVYTIDKETEDSNNTSERDDVKWTVIADFTKNGYRLPTEAEWEYAAGGGAENRTMYAGTSTDGNEDDVDDLGDYAWYNENNGYSGEDDYGTKEVGKKTANSLGLYDMSGNVWEHCWDWDGDYTVGEQSDPRGPIAGSDRIYRGGGWCFGSSFCRVADRIEGAASGLCYFVGLRVARSCAF